MTRESGGDADWSQLPHNPIAFFQLPADFDRKSLKRKYNQLIRKFKPEKAPAEFQKIRAAYELLDSRLRYGSTPATPNTAGFQWDTAQKHSAPKPLRPRPTAQEKRKHSSQPHDFEDLELQPNVAEVVEIPIYQRVESESISSIFKELKKRSNKTPYDYFCLAVLSDVATEDKMLFFKFILTGLQKYPHEAGLVNLLYEYLQQDFESKQIPGLLKTVAKVVTDQHFYFVTENLWDQLIRNTDFGTWAATLEMCESQLKDYRIEGQLAFYLHIMPAAIFKADANWLNVKYKFLDSNASETPPSLEMDLELVYQLFEYRQSISNDKSYSPEIHQAIVKYYLADGQKKDEAVIELQTAFAQNPGRLLEQFEPDTPYNNQQLVIWDYVNDDVCQRRELFSVMDPRQLRAKIYDLMDDLNRSEYALFGWREEIRYRTKRMGPYALSIISPFVLLGAWFASSAVVITAIALAMAGTALVHFWYRPADRYDLYIEKRMERRYLSDWRGRFVHLFEATQIHHSELSDALVEIVENHGDKVGFAAWLCRFLPADVGLHLFASAARYLK